MRMAGNTMRRRAVSFTCFGPTSPSRQGSGSQERLPGKLIELELVADETLLVLDGSGQLQVDGGHALELRPGDMISLRKGARTKWLVDEAFREFWVYSSMGA